MNDDHAKLSELLKRERAITAEIDKLGAARTRLRRRAEELRKKIVGQLPLFTTEAPPARGAAPTKAKAKAKRRAVAA